MADFYFNYYSVSSLIAFSMGLVLSTLFLIIRGKSPATLHFSLALACVPVFNAAYFISSSYYNPDAAFHRWLTVAMAVPIGLHLTMLFFHFPRTSTPVIARIVLVTTYVLAVFATVNFMYGSLSAPRVYNFAGHYWDFKLPGPTRIVAILILFNPFVMLIVGGAKAITHEGRERMALIGLLLVLVTNALIQVAANILSREGLIGRDTFQTIYSLTIVLGFFLVIIVYINNTSDRTSFMTKLIGITLVTLLLVMQALSFFSLRDKEQAYDQLRRYEFELALTRNKRPAGLEYIKRHDPEKPEFLFVHKNGEQGAGFTIPRVDITNTIMRARLQALKPADFKKNLAALLKDVPPPFAGYRSLIRAAATDSGGPSAVLRRISEAQDMLRRRRIRIRKLPHKDFRAALEPTLAGARGDFKYFAAAISAHVRGGSSEGVKLKREVLDFLAPMQPPGVRRFIAGGNPVGTRNFTAFLHVDAASGAIHEAGFAYRAYREYMHVSARTLVYLLLGVLLLVLIGFRVFFRGALVTPLNNLLGGVDQVNAGELQVAIPVRVRDEFGYLTDSFNGMVASIREGREKLQDYADHLEEKVKERTQELRTTLDQVQLLKSQQDGDYFLTSLLIRPLGANRAKSESVSVEFLVRQKKQFKFRKWAEEIGGDICMSDNVVLREKNYTIFLNADAMGKSMQGAGGALVLGAVFDAIIKRTKLSSDSQRQFPERWLKYAFLELHKVFISFDGSMLISLVIGLVEEDTGMLYYINAEHPWSVLYRGGTATFIEDALTFRKLGTPGVDGQIYIQTIQMEPGDVIISGSDGRDDLKFVDDQGKEVIGDDENEFLRRVEESDGLLERILPALTGKGDLTDDLSLVRVAYREDHVPHSADVPERVAELVDAAREHIRKDDYRAAVDVLLEARTLDDLNRRAIKLLARAYIKMERYDLALSQAEDYTYIAPGDTDFVFLTSYCHRKLKNYSQAADYGERVRLRLPGDTRNLAHLAEIYIRLGNTSRGRELVDQALVLEPDHERALKIQGKLDEMANVE